MLLTSCAPQGELEPWHAPSGLATPLPAADFAGYVDEARATVAAAQRQLGREPAPELIEARAPFELAPAPERCPLDAAGRHPRAVLLIHGLGGTPYEMRALGERFAAACYLVRAILLPGHGTVPGDLLEVGADDWREAVRRGMAGLAGVAEEVHLVGFAEGGTLALGHALAAAAGEEPAPRALVLLAPALAQGGFADRAARYLDYGAIASAHQFAELLPDDDPARYSSLARRAEQQASALSDRLDGAEQPLAVPVFMALSAADAVVDVAAARRWFCRGLIGPRHLLWYAGDAPPAEDCGFVETRAGGAPPEILDLAHRALPIAPEDAHYGTAGDYLDCRHYYHETDTPNWLLCLDPGKTPANSALRYGEITPENLASHLMRRLTYNPDFAALAGDILSFIDGLPWQDPPIPSSKPTT